MVEKYVNLHVYLTNTSYEHLVCGTSCSGPWECTVSQADRNPEASKHPSKHCTKVLCESEVKSLSRVRLFAIPWTVAYQVPLSLGFSRQ